MRNDQMLDATADKDRVYLIDLGTGTDRSLMPLGCGLLASYAQSQPDLKAAYDFKILMLEETIEGVLESIEAPAIIGLACYVWHFSGVIDLTVKIREQFPDTLIVWGGPSVPQDPDRIRALMSDNPAVDILVHMEGEITFADVLKRRFDGQKKSELGKCPGITFRGQDSIVTTEPRERIGDFTDVPSPYLTGVFDDVMDRYGHFIVGILWETSRGCPFKCAFCDWGNAAVNKVNRLDVDRVLQEITWASEREIHYVYCTDANFGISFRRDREIAERFVEIANGNGYPNTLILNWTKNQHRSVIDIADVLHAGGVTTNTTISTQSFHEPALKASLRDNIKLEEYRNLKKAFHDRGLATYSELILGLPEETLETFLAGIDTALSVRLQDQVMVYPCVVLENTHLQRTKKEYGIESRRCAVGLNRRRFKYPRFGEDEVVVGSRTMPIEDWRRAYMSAFLLLSLYNLRISFYPIVLLKHLHDVRVTDLVTFMMDKAFDRPDEFPQFHAVVTHLHKQTQMILDGVSSVSAVDGSDGVAFTPHEAAMFLFLSNMDETYAELPALLEAYCRRHDVDADLTVIEEAVHYQRARIPIFASGVRIHEFRTNVATALENIVSGLEPPPIAYRPTRTLVDHPAHEYGTEAEFNRRRVACGYTLNLAEIVPEETSEAWKLDSEPHPAARNANLAGRF
jgi:radical SAM superfamily enzyme YgiQ (UPF0313 family)